MSWDTSSASAFAFGKETVVDKNGIRKVVGRYVGTPAVNPKTGAAYDTVAEYDVNGVPKKVSTLASNLNIDEIKNDGITVRIGGKVVKLEVTEEITLPIDDIKADYEKQHADKVAKLQADFAQAVKQVQYMSDLAKKDFEAKEKTLNDKIKSLKPMPDVTFDHAKAGLSVVKGANSGEYFWMYQTVYWPKFVDNKPISPNYIKKMITPIVMVVATKDDKVLSVTTRKTIGLDKFDHYHNTGSNDCWGAWQHPSRWNKPEDIIKICKDATSILENINGDSLARRTPSGLPTFATLSKNLVSTLSSENKINKADERIGLTDADARDEITGGAWTT